MKRFLAVAIAVITLTASYSAYAEGLSLNLNQNDTQAVYQAQSAQTAVFSDTQISDWYYPHMKMLVDKGGINGYEDGTFRPDNTITNAEFIKTIIGLVSADPVVSDTHWAEGYIQQAENLGIVEEGELSQPEYDEPIRRQQMAKYAARTMEKVLKESPAQDAGSYISEIKDWAEVCESCKPYVAEVYAKGVICGMPDGTFSGGSYTTRAEATTMLVRLIDESYRVVMYSGVAFNQTTDVLEDGRMSVQKSKNFMDYTLENLKFYEENGKYYVSGMFPAMPDGYENWLTIDIERNDGGAVISFTNGFTMIEEQKLPTSGSFIKEIGLPAPDKINFIHIKIGVEATENQVTKSRSAYYNINSAHQNQISLVKETGEVTEYLSYDFSKLFQW